MKHKSNEINMTNGNLWVKIIQFAVPLMLTGMLQLLFNLADVVVVGRFSGEEALAAVGLSGPLINLIVNVFIGLSLGATIIGSRYYGEQNEEGMSRTSQTAVLISLISGAFLAILGNILATPILKAMSVPDEVLPLATLYVRIYFAGMPFIMFYNFTSGIMRAYGDTKRPLYFLCISGIINILLNLLFVIVFKMSVAGVALATTIAQGISAILNIITLTKVTNGFRINIRKLKIYKKQLISIIIAGVPAGLQSCMFSIANIVIQTSINSFGTYAIAGSSAESNIDGFLYVAVNAVGNTAVTATSQNIGARNIKNVWKTWGICICYATLITLILQTIVLFFREPLIYMFTDNPEVVKFGVQKLWYIIPCYVLLGVMEVSVGSLRGLGKYISTMVVSVFGVCLIRVIWINTVFILSPTLETVYISYPVSWGVSALIQTIMFLKVYKKKEKKYILSETEIKNA